MNKGKILDRGRIRQTHNRFGFIPHRFLRDGFLSSLNPSEAQLYLFYILAADRYGVSFYSDRRLRDLLDFSGRQLRLARAGLIDKDLICFDPPVCQVLELPVQPVDPIPQKPCVTSFTDLGHQIGN